MRDCYRYEEDSRHNDYHAAKKVKDRLRNSGYRVKIRKDANGQHVVFKKHVAELDHQRGYGSGRKRELIQE
jgi:threonine aldolase